MSGNFAMLKLSQLTESTVNPRFDLMTDETIDLSRSVATFGVLQPLTVSKGKDGYKILAGHRRAIAAQIAGLSEVPCFIRPVKGPNEVAHLVENVQRVDLTPAETGIAVYKALGSGRIKQKDLAEQLGKSEAWLSKFKTIGQAVNKFPTAAGLVDAMNADIAYHVALQLLGRGTEPKPPKAQQQPLDGLEKATTLEQIIEAAIMNAGLIGSAELKSIDQNADGLTVKIKFENEHAAKRLYSFFK